MGLQSSPEQPTPVRTVAHLIGQWIDRLGPVWVEGEVAQLTRRPGAGMVFLTLRDTAAAVSLSVTCSRRVLDACDPPLVEGARVVVHAKADFYLGRGTLSLSAREIRPVGLGELLARLERLRSMLAAEGLFAAERKRPLPFLPRTVGLVCGRASAAERDVVENARRRWPGVAFRTVEVPVQGAAAVAAVSEAVEQLDADPGVDVIVITRGGGSVEDLLPFSDERLVRAVARCATPVVSAIGHEQDTPLLDLVADLRASTPTDAARRVVPDVAEELRALARAHRQLRRAVVDRVEREQLRLAQARSRPVLAAPHSLVAHRVADVEQWTSRSRRSLAFRLDRAADDLSHARARVLALSPAATLDRGYAIVQRADGAVARQARDLDVGETLSIRLSRGVVDAGVVSLHDAAGGDDPPGPATTTS